MSKDHRLQQQRFELKYLIDERITAEMREFARCHLELDEYGQGKPNFAYPVHSLYFDSDHLETYHATINGNKNRFKLRLRYYDEDPNTPVFFEVKGRVNNCILKQRCGVRREAVSILAAGQLPDPGQLFSKEPRHTVALQRFITLVNWLNARPKLHNCYLREAWVSPWDNSVRVTFDRHVQVEPFFRAEATTRMSQPTPIYSGFVILELKFTSRFPNWLREMVRAFNLMQSASAKYAGGVVVLGESRFHDGYQTRDWQGLTPRELIPNGLAPELLPDPEHLSLIDD